MNNKKIVSFISCIVCIGMLPCQIGTMAVENAPTISVSNVSGFSEGGHYHTISNGASFKLSNGNLVLSNGDVTSIDLSSYVDNSGSMIVMNTSDTANLSEITGNII